MTKFGSHNELRGAMSSGPGSELRRAEEQLLEAAEGGDAAGVAQLLTLNPDLNPDVEDGLARTPLNLAVTNEHEEVRW